MTQETQKTGRRNTQRCRGGCFRHVRAHDKHGPDHVLALSEYLAGQDIFHEFAQDFAKSTT
jgi:hypothetical protein